MIKKNPEKNISSSVSSKNLSGVPLKIAGKCKRRYLT
jgi:hypothetical protein